MNEIGQLLRESRENAGVSLEEVSEDLNIRKLILENIEDGKIGSFKDIFVLKEYIQNYSKYLGLNADEINESFNEYLFEYTSKIPVKEIEKKVLEKEKEQKDENKINSPYTATKIKSKKHITIIAIILLCIIFFIGIVWAVKQIVISNSGITSSSVYINKEG